MFLFLIMYLINLFERMSERDLASANSLHKWPQQPWLRQVEVKSSMWVSYVSGRDPGTWTSCLTAP